jgi:N-acetylglucosaminyldiphosphoundecaprenol N-acetyl-beta-D-mannosaminyltransferase
VETLSIPSLQFQSRVVGSPSEFLEVVQQLYEQGGRNHVLTALNAEKIYRSKRSSVLKNVIDTSINFADGVGAVLALLLLRRVKIQRTWGFDMLLRALSERKGTIFLFGGSESVNSRVEAVLVRRFPGVRVVGRQFGFGYDSPKLLDAISKLKPDFLAVALGSPKQEEWIWEYGRNSDARFMMGVGGAFDAMVGEVKRAPTWIQNAGLEWLYRLIRQPSRFQRQTVLAWFMWAVIKDFVLRRKDGFAVVK